MTVPHQQRLVAYRLWALSVVSTEVVGVVIEFVVGMVAAAERMELTELFEESVY